MKKRLALTLYLATTIALTGCGTDEATKTVIDNINAIGDVDTSDIELIEETVSLYDNLTDEQKQNVSNVDALDAARSQLDDLKKQYAIENDKTAPSFEGLSNGEIIEVKGGTEFNLNEYLAGKLTISDDVTEGTLEYRTDCDSDAYDSVTGVFDTQKAADIPVKLVAVDEAGNDGTLDITVKVVPIKVTKEDPSPTLYEGKLGTIVIKSFTHDDNYGLPMYSLVFDFDNKSDKDLKVALKSARTTVNGFQAKAFYEDNFIPSGVRGQMNAMIYDEDIPSEAGDFSTIETYAVIFDSTTDEDYLFIPLTLDVNVSK